VGPIKKSIIFINMDNLEHDTRVLDKILNSPLFFDKYPMINRVWVTKYTNNIDITISIGESERYWPIREEIRSFIWNIAKMASVTSRFNIYP
jgi:hypothetical protein